MRILVEGTLPESRGGKKLSMQPQPGEETVEGIAARRFIQEYLKKAARELPQLLIEEAERKKEQAVKKRARGKFILP